MSSTNCLAAPSISACQPYREMTPKLALIIMKMLKVPTPKMAKATPMTRNVSQRRDKTVRWNQRFTMMRECPRLVKRPPAAQHVPPTRRNPGDFPELPTRIANPLRQDAASEHVKFQRAFEDLRRDRRVEHSPRGTVPLPARRIAPEPLCAGASGSGNQFHFPPPASRGDVRAVGRKRAARVPVFHQD